MHSLILVFSSSGRVRMASTKYLIDTFQSHIPLCQCNVLCSSPALIGFKLGRTLRFIWHDTFDGPQPNVITTRQDLSDPLNKSRMLVFK